MNLTQRERNIAIGVGVLLALFAAFELGIKPYMEARAAVASDVDDALVIKQQNDFILNEQSRLRREYKQMIADGLCNLQATARDEIHEAMDEWERAAGVLEKSRADQQITHEGDLFDQISFKMTGMGTTKTVAMLLNYCETTPKPFRVTRFVPKPVKEGYDYLEFDLTISTLYRRPDARGSVRLDDADLAQSPVSSAPEEHTLAEPLRILLTKSIFAKDSLAAEPVSRWGQRTPATTQATTAPAADPEADYVLRGVVTQDGVNVAAFEQTSSNAALSIRVGQPIARGQITAISLDGVDYLSGRKTLHINIGQTLNGITADAPRAASTTHSSGETEHQLRWRRHTDSDAPAPSPDTASPNPPGEDDRRSRDQRRPGDDFRGGPPPPDDGPDPIIINVPN